MARGLADGLLRFCNGAWRDNDGDAVEIAEVVRCKDCKFYHDKGYCTKITGLTRIKQDDFCSYGERIENGRQSKVG